MEGSCRLGYIVLCSIHFFLCVYASVTTVKSFSLLLFKEKKTHFEVALSTDGLWFDKICCKHAPRRLRLAGQVARSCWPCVDLHCQVPWIWALRWGLPTGLLLQPSLCALAPLRPGAGSVRPAAQPCQGRQREISQFKMQLRLERGIIKAICMSVSFRSCIPFCFLGDLCIQCAQRSKIYIQKAWIAC